MQQGQKIESKFGVFILKVWKIYTSMPKLAKTYSNSFNNLGWV